MKNMKNMKKSEKFILNFLYTLVMFLFLVSQTINAAVVINEIVYKDGVVYDSGDWFELFNDKDEIKDISGWIIEDDGGNQFTNPPSTTIQPYGFLVFYSGENKFTNTYPTVNNIVGPLPFKFGSNDTVIVRNGDGEKKDEVEYNDGQNWPDAYGNDRSIELVYPYNDNALAAYWQQSVNLGGSPGVKNPGANGIYVTEHDRTPDGPKSYEQVNITITAKDAFANLTSVVINVNYNGGAYSDAVMTAGANDQYSYTIQPTNEGIIVRYYFDFADDGGQTAQRWWAGSTNEPYLYTINNNPVLSGMVINEIMYNSSNIWVENAATTSNYEYVEIYNFNTQAVDVSYWQFHDENNKYRLPDSLTVPADGYIVLADKTQAVIDVYGAIPANALLISIPELGLANGGEIISWQTVNGEKINELTYNDKAPWPTEPDGNGPSLELINWTFDNSLPESWLSSTNFGTPGKENSVFVPEPTLFLILNFGFWICVSTRRVSG